ncbi:MAG: class II aldolase/adducin family protein [Crenarchaeota archaeon]|nr:class II aldolase/adducin family protein [Thermoproteota archaeon]MCR8501573.1 class II aldolase/adducin family protein [Thermoproteota archaeon]
MDLSKLKGEIIRVGRLLIRKNLTVGSSGNISVRIPGEDRIIITPSGVPFRTMLPEELVIIDLDGRVIEGKKRPSSELPLHLKIYKSRPDVNAIIHAHTIYCSVLAATRTPIPPILDEMIFFIGGDILVAKYAPPGTEDLARNALEALGTRKAVILANHGVVACGRDLEDALETLVRVERISQIYILAKLIGEPKRLPDEVIRREIEAYELRREGKSL